MDSTAKLRVKAFFYTVLIYIPLFVFGAVSVFFGNLILFKLNQDLFTTFIGGSLVIAGASVVIVAYLEPIIKLFSYSEAINSPVNNKGLDVSKNYEKTPVGVKINHQYDLKEVANEIIQNECKLLGKPYCLKVAKVTGLDVDENGNLKNFGKESFPDLEKLVSSYAKAFGRPAIFAAETILAKYPDLKFKTIYQ